ncbi:MAG: YeeE/YedE family protein [Gammaproteobacteria bacterium]|nr:YeeE/YedE family protein [Gammaproteobacteria bacterium]
MTRLITAAITGMIFGIGLALSQMIDRQRVLGFLDVAGSWDPTLLFVLGGAVGVTLVAFRFVLTCSRPVLDDRFYLPTRKDIDRPLVAGAIVFGVGWGLAGYCPGPAVAGMTLGVWNPVLFVVCMVIGSWIRSRIEEHSRASTSASSTA